MTNNIRSDVHLIPALKDNYIAVVRNEATNSTIVVDPSDPEPILSFLRKHKWRADLVLNTHHHWDHVGGNHDLKKEFGCPVVASEIDGKKIVDLTRTITDNETIPFGNETFRAIYIPGHTLGHTAFYFEQSGIVFTGDTLFSLGCGRLFEGTPTQMWSSLQRLSHLPSETKIYCGHEYTLSNSRFALAIDPDNIALKQRTHEAEDQRKLDQPTLPTTIGLEKQTNPFLRADEASIRRNLQMPDAPAVEIFAKLRSLKDNF